MQLRLQREVFDPLGEHLLALINCKVFNPDQRKLSSPRGVFICLLKESGSGTVQVAELREGLNEVRSYSKVAI